MAVGLQLAPRWHMRVLLRLLMPAVESVAHHAAQEAVVKQADKLLPLLAALTAYQASGDTRRGALETLTSLALELPRHVRCLLASAFWVNCRSSGIRSDDQCSMHHLPSRWWAAVPVLLCHRQVGHGFSGSGAQVLTMA